MTKVFGVLLITPFVIGVIYAMQQMYKQLGRKQFIGVWAFVLGMYAIMGLAVWGVTLLK